ncbi:repeat-containing domain protein, partial [gut metagenome]
DQQRENTSLTMKNVDRLNTAIAKMCEDEGYKYLDSSKALEDPKTGWAKKDYTGSDGVHLSQKGVRAFFKYVRTHAYITEDIRPKPLKKVPKVVGVTPNIITNDPIAVRGAKVPVEFVAGEGGRIEGETSQQVKKGLQTSTVRAVPDEGWEFDGWTATLGHVDQKAEITFTVPGNADANGVVLTAHFVPQEVATEEPVETPTPVEKVTVKFRVFGDGGAILGAIEQNLERGKKAQMVEAVPDEGWEFVCWDATSDTKENKVPQTPQLQFIVPEDVADSEIIVTATFRKIEESPVTPIPEEAPATPQPTVAPTAVPLHCDI